MDLSANTFILITSKQWIVLACLLVVRHWRASSVRKIYFGPLPNDAFRVCSPVKRWSYDMYWWSQTMYTADGFRQYFLSTAALQRCVWLLSEYAMVFRARHFYAIRHSIFALVSSYLCVIIFDVWVLKYVSAFWSLLLIKNNKSSTKCISVCLSKFINTVYVGCFYDEFIKPYRSVGISFFSYSIFVWNFMLMIHYTWIIESFLPIKLLSVD